MVMRCRIIHLMEISMTGPFKLAPLPWEEEALEPAISAKTISFHYHKHHQTYVDTLNKLVAKTKFADMKLEKIIQATAGRPMTTRRRSSTMPPRCGITISTGAA